MDACTDFGEIVDTSSSCFRQNRHSMCTQEPGMEAYQGGVHTVCVGIVIILVCGTNITASIHLDNATISLNSYVSKHKYQSCA